MKLNGTHQLLVYADDVNILQGIVCTKKENPEALVVKGIGLEVKADKAKYMVMPREQDRRKIHSVKTDNSFFEKVGQFKYNKQT